MVLVLDDDADLRETVSAMLAEDGYRVCTANDPVSALAQLGSQPVGIVVMDYAIPNPAEGEAFLRAKAADPRIAKVPVILMSGYEVNKGMPGIAAVLPKPFDVETLLATVRRLLGPPEPTEDGSSR